MTYPETLKAISIHAPHAYAICQGIKKREYRSRAAKHNGWILIHASQSKASDKYFADYGIDKSIAKRGAIIGAAFLTDCIWDEEIQCYGYLIGDYILFDQPLEGIKGCQAIFWGAKSPEKQAAFQRAWEIIQAAEHSDFWEESDDILDANENNPNRQEIDDISIEADTGEKPIEIPGYELEIIDNPDERDCTGYRVFDSLTKEFLFQIYENFNGWKNDFTRQTYETHQEAVSIAREKAIERIERSISLEIKPIRMKEADLKGATRFCENQCVTPFGRLAPLIAMPILKYYK